MENAPKEPSPQEEIPLTRRLLNWPFFLLFAGLLVMILLFVYWGFSEITRLRQISPP